MTIAQDFIKKLQAVTGTEQFPKKFWEGYDGDAITPTFHDVLNRYAEYYTDEDLSSSQKEALSEIFWEQILAVGGTPIIEDSLGSDNECEVYFLAPQKLLEESKERAGTKMDLYLQGDFHGYGSTDGRQQLSEIGSTGIMFRKDKMSRDALVSYQYIQVEPSDRGKKPKHEFVTFFEGDTAEPTLLESNIKKPPNIASVGFIDKYSTHISPYPGCFHPEKTFRVNSDQKHAHIEARPIDWLSLLSTQNPGMEHFVYHDTLYSDQAGELQHGDALEVTKEYHDDLYYSDQPDKRPDSPYAKFTRAIQVFKPTSGVVDNLIVINDGTPYLITGILDHFEKMVKQNKLSPNTAFVLINPMPALKTTLSSDKLKAYNEDDNTHVSGMGVRMIDYKYGIDQYADFIQTHLFPTLINEGIPIPEDPARRIMIGSSLSGTASIYIGLNTELFGGIIAQSPSPANRDILRDTINTESTLSKPKANIHLSCGVFEQPGYADNTNLPYAIQLSQKLHIPLYDIGDHGHQFLGWNEALERSLPVTLIYRAELSATDTEEMTQKYRTALVTMKDTQQEHTATEEGVEEHSTPSPFKTVPKPFDDA